MRVWVVDREGRQASFEWPRVVPAVSVEELVQASYRPDTPAHLQLDTEGEQGAVSYTELYCAVLYCAVLYCAVLYCAVLYLVQWASSDLSSQSLMLLHLWIMVMQTPLEQLNSSPAAA